MDQDHRLSPPNHRVQPTTETGFRFRHLNHMFWALELGIVAILLVRLAQGRAGMVELLLALTGLVVAVVPVMVRRGKSDQAAVFMLSTLAVVFSLFMWLFKGLRDEIALALPALIIFTAIMGHRRLFVVLTAYCMVTVAAIGIANHLGWHENIPAYTNLTSAFIIVTVLAVTAYTAWVVSRDLRYVFATLQEENRRVIESQARIQEMVFHDSLTGLPNRSLAREHFDHALSVARRREAMVCLMFIDLDHFKPVNDSFGHQSGDDLLVRIAVRLEEAVRESDMVCRQGGDEFLVILDEVRSQEQAVAVALKLLEAIREPVAVGDANVVLTASIGIAMSPADGEDFELICKLADLAMYDVKEKGRNGYRFFNSDMNTNAMRSLQMLTELREALPQGELELHFQPKICLRTGRVVGAEALTRWQHPRDGLILPGRFIPLAERSGLIVEITEWALPEACRACAEWHRAGFTEMTVAVNVSTVDFKRGHIVELVDHALRDTGLAADKLELELTESILIDDTGQVRKTLDELRALGVVLAIDDFGTGYSSLQYLKQLNVSVLKIDRSFISRIDSVDEDRNLVEAMIGIARSFDLKTVAEGVDSISVMDMSTALGCDTGQGFHWARALPPEEFQAYLTRASADAGAF